MPVIVGASGTGSEGKSDRLGLATGTSDPGSAAAGDMYYKTDDKKVRVYDGSAWGDLAAAAGSTQPTDGGNGGGSAYASSTTTNATGITNTGMTQHISSWYKSGGGTGTPLTFIANETNTPNFAFHTGHNGNSSHWPMYFAIQVDASTPRVCNQLEWVKHSNAVGNVDMYGSNNSITSSNYTDVGQYTFLGRVHMGGQGSENDGTHKKGYFNHWAWGYKWYMLRLSDAQGAHYHGNLHHSENGVLDGWAMYGLRLNKLPDWIGDGYLPTDAFSDGNCKAHYKFESNFNDSTGIGHAIAGGGGTAGNASEIGLNAYSGGTGSSFYTPSNVSPIISDYMAGNNAWGVSAWFKIDSSATTNCPFFHGARGDDHNRPGCWLRRIDGSNYQMEYFTSSNGSGWDICKGDVGSGTDARGNLRGITKNEWHHFAWSRNTSGDYDAFIDGQLDFHYSNSASLYSSGAYAFVWANWFHEGSGYGFHGLLDNVRFFNRNLTTTDVMSLYLRHS